MPDNTQNLHKKGLGLPHTIRLNSGQRMNQGRSQGCVSCFRHAVWQNSEAEHARHRPESERGKSCEFSAISCGWCWSASGWRSAIWEPAYSTASPLSAFRSASSRSKWPSLRSGRSAHRSTVCELLEITYLQNQRLLLYQRLVVGTAITATSPLTGRSRQSLLHCAISRFQRHQ